MAGFWTGLAHGTILCSAAVAALSLAFPDAGRAPEAGQHDGNLGPVSAANRSPAPGPDGAVTGAVEKTEAPPPTPDPHTKDTGLAATGLKNAATGPDGAPPINAPTPPDTMRAGDAATPPGDVALPDPVGSEFRRGLDQPPAAPLPMQAGADWPAAPHASAPGAEAAPKPIEGLPGTPAPVSAPAVPAGQVDGAESPQIDAPAWETRAAPAQPGPVAVVTADLPPVPPSAAPEPRSADAADDGASPALGGSADQPATVSDRLADEPAAERGAPPPSDAQISAPAAPQAPAADAAPPLSATPPAAAPRDSMTPQDASGPRPERPAPDLRLPAPLGQRKPGGLRPAAPDTRPDLSDLRAP